MESIRLRPGAPARAFRGHPWVYKTEIKSLPQAQDGSSLDGEVILVRDSKGRQLGSAIYNSQSQIACRIFRKDKGLLDEAFLRSAISKALSRRVFSSGTEVGRLIWSESDNLPGLIVDRYGEVLVMQFLTLAMDQQTDLICSLLQELVGNYFSVGEMILRNDAPSREHEGLETYVRVHGKTEGEALAEQRVSIEGMEYLLDLCGGQKTGFYLDQRLEHSKVSEFAKGRRVLDAFCNQGGFALHCAKAGATFVEGVDSSGPALAGARENAERNLGPEHGIRFTEANVFDFLRQTPAQLWDLVILDPPAFAKNKRQLEGALRGYKELNLRGLQQLSEGGVLATYSCSHHISHDLYWDLIADAAADAGRDVRLLSISRQAPDHPVVATMPESEYLRGFIVQVE